MPYWRREWKICFDNLKSNNYNIAGALYIQHFKSAVAEYKNYYSGNFWWATCSYINTLPNLYYISNLNNENIIDYRMQTELWIGKSPHRWLNLYDENICGHDTHIYDKNKYKF